MLLSAWMPVNHHKEKLWRSHFTALSFASASEVVITTKEADPAGMHVYLRADSENRSVAVG